jgi:hypothetical protein
MDDSKERYFDRTFIFVGQEDYRRNNHIAIIDVVL